MTRADISLNEPLRFRITAYLLEQEAKEKKRKITADRLNRNTSSSSLESEKGVLTEPEDAKTESSKRQKQSHESITSPSAQPHRTNLPSLPNWLLPSTSFTRPPSTNPTKSKPPVIDLT